MKTNIMFVLSDNNIAHAVGDSINDAPSVGDIVTFEDNAYVISPQFAGVQFRVVNRVVSYGKQFNNLPGFSTVLIILEFVN